MGITVLTDRLLEQTAVYRMWQSPFVEQKFAPILAHNDVSRVRRVLDVGCGPGTNAGKFQHSDYSGIDFNESYIEYARQRYGRTFQVADVTKLTVSSGQRFDFILLNSLLHHLPTDGIESILNHLTSLLADDGAVHILELVLPPHASLARTLARWDRGKFARPLDVWQSIFEKFFKREIFQPYPVKALGMTAWSMVYFKGSAR